MERRKFLLNSILGGTLLTTQKTSFATHVMNSSQYFDLPKPTPAQEAFMSLQRGMFICYGINTYYDKEWSDGTLDKSIVNPTHLDTDQWCKTAKNAGMKYVLFTTKHHDGFCNWNTKTTDYSIMNTPFKKDIVAELKNSCEKHGLKLGLYFSLWDLHEKIYQTDERRFVDFMVNQLDELMSNYGEIIEVWFDGFWKKQKSGWETKKDKIEGEDIGSTNTEGREERFINAWRKEGAYRWGMDRLYDLIKSKSPNCMVINNPTTAYKAVPLFPVDVRCAEKGQNLESDCKTWNWLGEQIYLPLQIETTLSIIGDAKFPSGNWFWHEWDHSVATKQDVIKWLESARKLEANILLNCGISNKGKLRIEDENLLNSL